MKTALAISTFMREENFENRFQIFKECINSFCESNYDGTLHLVDDGSETKRHLHWVGEKKDDRIVVHFKPENGGVSRTKNTCIRLCLEDPEVKYFFLSDDDMVFKDKNWHEDYVKVMESTNIHHFSYALTSCARKTARVQNVNGVEVLRTAYVNGCFLTCSRKLIEQIGYFKVLPHKYGHEHSNFSVRCNKVTKGFYDLKNSIELLELNGKSHDTKSIVVNKVEMAENGRHVWVNNKEPLVE
jgi:glycosyltransferase involved in cell wall biosynthesis